MGTTIRDWALYSNREDWDNSVQQRESQTMIAENFENLISDGRSVVLFWRNRCKECKEYAEMVRGIIGENKEDLYDVSFHEVNIADPLNLWTRQSAKMKSKAWLTRWKVPYIAVFHNWEKIWGAASKDLETTKTKLLTILEK